MNKYIEIGGASAQGWLYDSLLTRLKADASKAKANLMVYFSNPVGIGEHPDVSEEMYKLVQELAAAEDALKTLNANFGDAFAANKVAAPESPQQAAAKLDASDLDSPEITP